MSTPKRIEHFLERTMYASRWIMAPIYFGMTLILAVLAVKFFQELWHFIPHVMDLPDTEIILKLLTFIDLALVGSLTVIVMFSGYENFVSRMDIESDTEKLEWLGTHDYGSLKTKVTSSIVAISSIHLLKIFMNLHATETDKLQWYVIIHLTLVVSAFFMGYLDKISKH
ncbi:TIGR00645 family protein [Methylomonas sp. MED-D]|uniref:TIGR00645 family protein n=1 Tax=unclassified Methylomonas TaxID=2608980 RepID=UPI000A7F7C94|nr:TIGR00645 family protein [Methylomonas koyamae]